MNVASLGLETVRADNLAVGNLRRVVRARYDEMPLSGLRGEYRRLADASSPSGVRERDFVWWRIQLLQLAQGIGG